MIPRATKQQDSPLSMSGSIIAIVTLLFTIAISTQVYLLPYKNARRGFLPMQQALRTRARHAIYVCDKMNLHLSSLWDLCMFEMDRGTIENHLESSSALAQIEERKKNGGEIERYQSLWCAGFVAVSDLDMKLNQIAQQEKLINQHLLENLSGLLAPLIRFMERSTEFMFEWSPLDHFRPNSSFLQIVRALIVPQFSYLFSLYIIARLWWILSIVVVSFTKWIRARGPCFAGVQS